MIRCIFARCQHAITSTGSKKTGSDVGAEGGHPPQGAEYVSAYRTL